MVHVGNICNLDGTILEPVDCICGGSPCQDLSVAGNRAGLDGERSGLFMEQIRIVKEMREEEKRNGRTGLAVRPRFMVWENVPGAFSSNGGKDFQQVLTAIIRIAETSAPAVPMPEKGRWPRAGILCDELGKWSVAYRLHDAQYWGVPQRRKRIALVADFNGLAAGEILFDPQYRREAEREKPDQTVGDSGTEPGREVHPVGESLRGNPAESRTEREGVAGGTEGGAGTADENRITDYTAVCVGNGQMNQISMAQVSNPLDTMHGKQAVMKHGKVRRLTPIECTRLQGYPDDWLDLPPKTDMTDLEFEQWQEIRRTAAEIAGKEYRPCKTKEQMVRWYNKMIAADSNKYKAFGNSIALPFWFWFLRRISAQCERRATLGSLFDGIGGFPLCWEQCNGPGTAIWASEVEPYPIAVTKYHFGKSAK